MSGGSFEYLCLKADDSDIFNYQSLTQLEEMETYLKSIDKPDAAEIVKQFKDEIVAARTKIFERGNVLYELLHHTEWVASGDYSIEAIDKAMARLQNTPDNITKPL